MQIRLLVPFISFFLLRIYALVKHIYRLSVTNAYLIIFHTLLTVRIFNDFLVLVLMQISDVLEIMNCRTTVKLLFNDS